MLAESMVAASSAAISHPDGRVVQRVCEIEPRVDDLHREIDAEAVRLMSAHSLDPAARQFLLAVIRVNATIERIGDQAVSNCEYIDVLLSEPPPAATCRRLSQVSALVLRMLREALDAFGAGDPDKARRAMVLDEDLDALDAQIVGDTLEEYSGGGSVASSATTLGIARSLERIGDYAGTICEEICQIGASDA